MPSAPKPKTVANIAATRDGSTYRFRIEVEAGKAVLFQVTSDQALRLADTLDDLLAAEEVEIGPPPPAAQ